MPGPRAGYQGFPYTTPPVTEAPSSDPATAASWVHLPRRQVELPVQWTEPKVYFNKPDGPSSAALPRKPEPTEAPVVYIDLPEGTSSVSAAADDNDDGESRTEDKREPGDDPVVYIEMPDTGGSEVTRSSEPSREPDYVQETIFFNPFEERRMEMHKPSPESESGGEESPPRQALPRQPVRPTTLDLYGAGTSGAGPSSGSRWRQTSLPSKQSMVYGDQDTYSMSPIPASEFPEPPPAYAEIDRVSSPAADPQEVVTEQPRQEEPPRTQVILPRGEQASTPVGIPNSERKYLNCHHCGMRVHTLVIRENGTITHCVALVCLLVCMLPCVACIYCTDALKIRNHYCPSCNKVIGYELPCGERKILYVN